MYLTFQNKATFWYMFTAAMLLLMSYAIFHLKTDDKCSVLSYSFYGVASGIVLFALFWLGNVLIGFFHLPFNGEISSLYRSYSPSQIWHYIVLFLFIIPGEELFWRGFVQKKLSATKLNIKYSVLLAAVLYASVQLYSGYFIHFFAALIAGLFWGFLYAWKRNMHMLIISHLVFDLFTFVLLPFR
nr:CPBP family intramembrane glutamic endopeptidase [Bacillus benzoevorans]